MSTRPVDQRKWLVEKFPLYQRHHDSKTLKQFFPALYEEYFALWPPTPTTEAIAAVDGDIAAATAGVYKTEANVRTLTRSSDLRANHVMISKFIAGCSTVPGRNTG